MALRSERNAASLKQEYLRVHAVAPASRANGPGLRYVLWVQGCSIRCPGCFNPETHPAEGGVRIGVEYLLRSVMRRGDFLEGVTVTGGEPLDQAEGVCLFLQQVKARSTLSTILFTGYEFSHIEAAAWGARLLRCVDLVVAGPYKAASPWKRDLRSSANQTLHFITPRYTLGDLSQTPRSEVIIDQAGRIIVTGLDPLKADASQVSPGPQPAPRKGA